MPLGPGAYLSLMTSRDEMARGMPGSADIGAGGVFIDGEGYSGGEERPLEALANGRTVVRNWGHLHTLYLPFEAIAPPGKAHFSLILPRKLRNGGEREIRTPGDTEAREYAENG